MGNKSKLFSLVLVLLLSFAALPGFVKSQAVTGPFGPITVELNGDGVGLDDVLSVERGDAVEVKVRFTPPNKAEGVRIDAELRGLEDENVEDRTDTFDVVANKTYIKTLTLDIPEDLSEDDLDKEFTLKIDFDGDVCTGTGTSETCSPESQLFTTGLIVTSARHDLRVQDVVFRSGSTVDAGGNLFVTVWVENKGSKAEEDINVQVSAPELGLSARDKIDELVTAALEDKAGARDRDTDTEAVNFALKVPSDATAGDYDLVVKVDYNRGRDTVKQTETFTVTGGAAPRVEAETIVTVDTTSQSVNRGEGTIYKFSFANLGKQAKTFSVDVAGAEPWGSVRVDPSFVTVQPGATSEAFVFVTAKDDASLGKHLLTANVKEGSIVLKSVSLEADVKGQAPTAVTGAASWDQVRKGLEIGFAVLLIILVILGIIIAIGKLRKGDGTNEEEPGQGEGQSYYYYPRY